ncbi:MAG: U32 family peptidase [Clostridia bacterium]|nr:U32 family peptidase [Clostridia bacterium]
MLKLSVGYQYNEDAMPFSRIVETYKESISEVYFAWVDQASGRSKLSGFDGYFDYGLQDVMIKELKKIKAMDISLDLLFNANCYGEDALSEVLRGKVVSVIDYLESVDLKPDTVTTTSPAVAFIIKETYPEISVKASVNMKINSVKGMQYIAHLFDEYCVAKECNRNLPLLKSMKSWAEQNGKKITILANSGCMRDCSGQIFHDNLVAHESEIAKQKNIEFLPYMCWNYLKDEKNFVSVLQNTWIRPEDIHNYEGLADCVKLATRTHHLPGLVIGSYARRFFTGNLLDLFEPGFGPAFAPMVIDSTKIPENFWKSTTECDKNCEKCDYCKSVLKEALIIS